MAESYSLDEVRSMTAQPSDSGPTSYSLDDVNRMHEAVRAAEMDALLKRETTDMGYGVRRGLRDAWDTGAELLAKGYDKMTGADQPTLSSLVTGQKRQSEYERVRAMNDAARAEATAGRPTTPGSVLGYVGGNALATAPVFRGMQVGLGATGVPVLQSLGNAISSGGMTTGRAAQGAGPLARTADMALRMGGGALNGYIAGGLADPESANTGAAIGTALPPALQVVRAGARGIGQIASALRPAPGVSGADVRAARDIAEMAGVDPRNLRQVQELRDALRQQGPQIIEGGPTVPEILQTPGVSQLQRSAQAVQPAPFAASTAERELARRAVLARIAPVGNPGEVAGEVGASIGDYAQAAHATAKNNVSAKFGSVDPFNESRVLLPIDQMQAVKDKFLGPGTFGSGGMPQQAINEAKRIGMEALPSVRPVAVGRQPQDVLQAVRKLGGINPNSAGGMNREIVELGRKQTGTTGLVSAKGRTIDQMAELMHERGFLSAPDPAELLDAMRGNLGGRASYGADLADDAFRGRYEAAMGDAPQAGASLKPVTFDELQNLRSSIGEQWRIANRSGNFKEAAALDGQRRVIDSALDNLAAGKGQAGEYFAPDMVRNYKDARAAHAAKELRFRTGPQSSIFRQGSDGLPMAQGAEIPPKFFNAKPSQAADAQSFRRLVQDDPRLVADLRRFAVSQAADQTDRMGNLTNAKFSRWLEARSAATGEIFTPQQRAWLKAIADDLHRADVAESLGRSTGSDTMQKAASMMRLGLADSPAAQFMARRVPFGGLLMDTLSGPARAAKAERFGGLLMDPQRTGGLLDTFIATQQPQAAGLLGQAANPLAYRAGPLLLSNGGN